MENSRIQLWQCSFPLVAPYMKIKEEPKESLDYIASIADGYCSKDIQMLQVQDNESNVNEMVIPEFQMPRGQDNENIVNEIAFQNQITQGQDNENIVNDIAIPEYEIPIGLYNNITVDEIGIQNQITQSQNNVIIVNEIVIPDIQITQGQNKEVIVKEIVIPEIQIPQGQDNENIVNEISILEYQKPQGQYNKSIVSEIAIPEKQIHLGQIGQYNKNIVNSILQSQYEKSIVNEIVIPDYQIPQDPYNKSSMNEFAIPENKIPQGQYNENFLNEIAIPAIQIPQVKDNENIVNEVLNQENQIPLGQYYKSNINETGIPENPIPRGQYNMNFVNEFLKPENQVNLSDMGNGKDVVKCRIKGCICINPYTTPYMNRSSPRQKHLPRLTKIRRPFMNSSSPRRRHLPRLTRIKLPPLKRIKSLPLESGNNKLISNLPQPNATPLIISTQEIIHRIIQKSYKNYSLNSNVNTVCGNQNVSIEVNKDLSKRILKKSVSMIKRKSPTLPGKILHMKENIHNEIFGTVFEYSKKNLVNNRVQGEYRCIECGYRSKYSHHIKKHIKSHNFYQNKENQKQIPSCNMYENNQIYSLDKVDQMENKVSPCPIPPTRSKRIRKKSQWQKCPLCLYISNSIIALTNHINLSHKTHQKQKNYVLNIERDRKIIENNLSKNYCLRNDRIEKKVVSTKSRTKSIEVCSVCGFNTYSLPELNFHLRSHIPHEFQKGNSVEKFICDNQTLPSTESNTTNERKMIISEGSDYVKDNTSNASTIKYGIKGNHKRLKISEFFPILDLNISNKFPRSINDQEKNEVLIDTEYNKKQNSEIDKIGHSDSMIKNKYVEEERLLYDFIKFEDKKVSENTSDVEEDRYMEYSDTEVDCEIQDNFQPINEVFRNPNDYISKENPRKSMFLDKFIEYSNIAKTTDNRNLDGCEQNELLDLSSEGHNDKVDEYNPLQSPLYKNYENNSNFKSKNKIKGISYFTETNNERGDLSCLECSACFKNPWDYKRHIKRSHKRCNECSPEQECVYRSSKEYPVLLTTKSFECSECNYASITKGSFVRHMQTHSIEKQFECNICGYRCTGSGELQRHIWVHKGGGKHLNFWPLSNFL